MTQSSKDSLNEWLTHNFLTLITMCVLLGGWITNYAVLGKRVESVEQRQSDLSQRFDREVVPRKEHEARDTMLDRRLDEMQVTLNEIRKEQVRLNGHR